MSTRKRLLALAIGFSLTGTSQVFAHDPDGSPPEPTVNEVHFFEVLLRHLQPLSSVPRYYTLFRALIERSAPPVSDT